MANKPFRFIKRIFRNGNSMAVLIPRIFRVTAGVHDGSEIIMEVYQKKIVIKPRGEEDGRDS